MRKKLLQRVIQTVIGFVFYNSHLFPNPHQEQTEPRASKFYFFLFKLQLSFDNMRYLPSGSFVFQVTLW